MVTATPAAGTYPAGTTITLWADEPATIYYTTNGTFTLRYLATDTAGNTSTPASQAYTVSSDTVPPVVTATPAAGTYPAGTTITLTANETATIRYTTDGSTPTTSSPVYSSPIPLTASFTLRYLATDTAGNTSTPASQAYTVSTPRRRW